MPNLPKEQLVKDMKTKLVFYFIDSKKKLRVKSKEIYKNRKQFVHFPFFKGNGLPKYDKCKKIIYRDLSEDLPRGFLKKWNTGYGFTKIYNSLIYPIISKVEIKQIIVQKNSPTKIVNGTLFLNPVTLDQSYPEIESLLTKQKDEKSKLVGKLLAKILPTDFEKPQSRYVKNSLSNFINIDIETTSELSDKDIDSLFNLASKTSQVVPINKSENILKTKEKIEEHYIEQVIDEFEKLFEQKTHTHNLERKWQSYFKKYSWIFSQLFSFPVLIFNDEAYVGGKNLDNKGGKFADFLYKNSLTNNIAFIEIKTHNTPILESRAYRGTDVFAMSKELSGALNQVLDQKSELEKDFYQKSVKSKEKFETYNSKCLIIIGNISEQVESQIKSFELLRSNSRNVDIVTFDEVLEKIKGLSKLMQGSEK